MAAPTALLRRQAVPLPRWAPQAPLVPLFRSTSWRLRVARRLHGVTALIEDPSSTSAEEHRVLTRVANDRNQAEYESFRVPERRIDRVEDGPFIVLAHRAQDGLFPVGLDVLGKRSADDLIRVMGKLGEAGGRRPILRWAVRVPVT
jgi:hypothetical protein